VRSEAAGNGPAMMTEPWMGEKPSMRNTIVVLGSSNTDMIVKVGRIPRPGETVIGGVFSQVSGGKGANQAVAAARAGGAVVFVGRVGTDAPGVEALAGYVRDGIDVSCVVRDPAAHTGVALIFVDAGGENSIAVASGANANFSPADVEGARDRIESAAVLLTGIPADTDRGAEAAAETLLARGVGAVILTLGTRGAYVASTEYRGIVPCYPVECVDSTAAGDVFNGVLATSLAEGWSLPEAARFASAAAAVSVTRMGAQPSAPRRDEIEAFLRKRG